MVMQIKLVVVVVVEVDKSVYEAWIPQTPSPLSLSLNSEKRGTKNFKLHVQDRPHKAIVDRSVFEGKKNSNNLIH